MPEVDAAIKLLEGLPDDWEVPLGVLIKVNEALKEKDELIRVRNEALASINDVRTLVNDANKIAELEAKAEALDKLEEMLKDGWDVKTIYKRGDKRHVWVETGCGETYREGRGSGPTLLEAILSASKGVEENQ